MTFPTQDTAGTLSLAFYAYVTVADAARSSEDGAALARLLEAELKSSDKITGLQKCGTVVALPPGGTERFTIAVTAMIDLTAWNAERGPNVPAGTVAAQVNEVLAATDVSSVAGASVDEVEMKPFIIG